MSEIERKDHPDIVNAVISAMKENKAEEVEHLLTYYRLTLHQLKTIAIYFAASFDLKSLDRLLVYEKKLWPWEQDGRYTAYLGIVIKLFKSAYQQDEKEKAINDLVNFCVKWREYIDFEPEYTIFMSSLNFGMFIKNADKKVKNKLEVTSEEMSQSLGGFLINVLPHMKVPKTTGGFVAILCGLRVIEEQDPQRQLTKIVVKSLVNFAKTEGLIDKLDAYIEEMRLTENDEGVKEWGSKIFNLRLSCDAQQTMQENNQALNKKRVLRI